MGHDGWVFSFHNADKVTACLDVAGGQAYNGANLEVWECNGQESQLFYFDAGTYQITYAGDPSKCIDSGDSSDGTQLFLWDCNGGDQQAWGFDSDSGTIYLAWSASDATQCMDIAGGDLTGGTPVQIWGCNNDLSGQHWEIMSGITIRLGGDNYGLCFDISGGSTDNGTPIQVWECNGLRNQLWIWESGAYQIKLAEDDSKCIDAGGGWDKLMLWDCNGQDQQNWGYDSSMGTIYSLSGSADAALCMDVSGGALDWGTSVGSWDCNGCWNQQFQVIGPVESAHSNDEKGLALGDCPAYPGPSPSPGPSPTPGPPPASGNFQDLCADGDQGWPVFNSYSDLANNGEWSTYFQSIYGSIPSDGYPICVAGFWFLYKSKYSSAGISDKPSVGTCPNSDFDHYDVNNGFQISDASWIYHSSWSAIPSDTWTEVSHAATKGEISALWAMNSPGSGLWIYTGNTNGWNDHKDMGSQFGCTAKGYDWVGPCAQKNGYDTVQFLQHHGNGWACPSSSHPMNIEIVIANAQGKYACGGTNPFRAGWRAQLDCDCNEGGGKANCGNTQISPR